MTMGAFNERLWHALLYANSWSGVNLIHVYNYNASKLHTKKQCTDKNLTGECQSVPSFIIFNSTKISFTFSSKGTSCQLLNFTCINALSA